MTHYYFPLLVIGSVGCSFRTPTLYPHTADSILQRLCRLPRHAHPHHTSHVNRRILVGWVKAAARTRVSVARRAGGSCLRRAGGALPPACSHAYLRACPSPIYASAIQNAGRRRAAGGVHWPASTTFPACCTHLTPSHYACLSAQHASGLACPFPTTPPPPHTRTHAWVAHCRACRLGSCAASLPLDTGQATHCC